MPNLDDERLMRSYLLGELDEGEQQRVEDRLFSDDAYFEYLLTLEEELIRDYAGGRLSRADRRRVERHLEDSPDWPGRVALARTLSKVLSDERKRRAKGARRHSPLALASDFGLTAARLVPIAVGLVLAMVGVWLAIEVVRLRGELDRARVERASAENRSREIAQQLAAERATREDLARQLEEAGARAAAAAPRARALSLVLLPGLTRHPEAQQVTFRIPLDAEVRFTLSLASGVRHERYRAILSTAEGEQVWAEDSLRISTSGRTGVLVLNVPGRVLAPADYILRLEGASASSAPEDVESYVFRVVR